MNEHPEIEVSDELREQMHRDHTKDTLITETAHWMNHAQDLEDELAGARRDLRSERTDSEATAIARCVNALDRISGSGDRTTSRHMAAVGHDGPPERSRVGRVLAYLAERYGQRPPDEHARRLEEDLSRANRRIEDLESQLRNVNASIMEDAL